MRHSSTDFDAIDLFAGIGWGFQARDLGLTELGLDNDKNVLRLRNEHNFHSLLVDLWNFHPEHLGLSFRGLIGSPSCVKFAQAGKGEGKALLPQILAAAPKVAAGRPVSKVLADVNPEAALVLAPLHWAGVRRPEWIALEQVTAVQPVWDAMAVELRKMGYSVDTGILSAEQFGSGQTRRRSILVANRDVEVALPEPTHSRYYPRSPERLDAGVKPWLSMAEALQQCGWQQADLVGFPRRDDGRGDAIEFGGVAYRQRDLRSAALPAQAVTEKARSWVRITDGEPELMPGWTGQRPSTTIVGSFRPDVVAAPGYRKAGDGPRQDAKGSVQVSVEEAAELQSFPADVRWDALARTAAFRVVGNAVPGNLARAALNAARGIR